MAIRSFILPFLGLGIALPVPMQSVGRAAPVREQPPIMAHSTWQLKAPVGHAADAVRRNKKAGDTLTFRDLTITVLRTAVDSTTTKPIDVAVLRLNGGAANSERTVREGEAFNWRDYHIAIVAIYGPGELGAGLVAIEVGTITSMPAHVAASVVAGGADLRLRVPHAIRYVTLHHTGDSRPLRPDDDPVARLRGLQSWGAAERNWWDVPYHFLLGHNGQIFEGRDWRFMGETNTSYDPSGHFLISMIGNYDVQEPTPSQLAAIADMMAWAVQKFDLPLDRIGGHYHYTSTGCPGKFLRPLLEDGTLRRMVEARLPR